MSWNWKSFRRGSGAVLPGVVLATRHNVLIDAMVAVLCHKAAAEEPDELPTMTRTQIQAEVRKFYRDHGTRGLESYWGEDLIDEYAAEVETWASAQVAAAWPEYAAHVLRGGAA